MIYRLESAGYYKGRESFDVTTPKGAYRGIIADAADGTIRVYFNSSATKGSKRKFASRSDALQFIQERRIKKGWSA